MKKNGNGKGRSRSSTAKVIKFQESTLRPQTSKASAGKRGAALEAKIVDTPHSIFTGLIPQIISMNPDPTLALSGADGLRLYEKMDLDPILKSCSQTRTNDLARLPWRINDGGTESIDVKIGDHVRKCFANVNRDTGGIRTVFRNLMDGRYKGFSVNEAIWNVAEGMIDRLLHHIPQAFEFGRERPDGSFDTYAALNWYGRELFYREGASITNSRLVKAPPYKFIHFTPDERYGNPYGDALYSHAYWAWYFSFPTVLKYWVNWLERWAQPTVVFHLDQDMWNDKDLRENLLLLATNIQNEFAGTVPVGKDGREMMKVLEASGKASTGSTGGIYESFMSMLNRWKAMLILGAPLSVMEAEHDTRAASVTHAETTRRYTEADARAIEACLNSTFIRWQVDMRFGYDPNRVYPTFEFETDEPADLNSQIKRDQIGAGLVDIPEDYFYKTYGWPAPDREEGTGNVTERIAKSVPPSPGLPFADRVALLSSSKHVRHRDELFRLLERAMEEIVR